MKLIYALAAALSFLVSPALNACNLNVRFFDIPDEGMVRLEWDGPSADTNLPLLYDIFARRADGVAAYTLFQYAGGAASDPGTPASKTLVAAASEPQLFEYLVVARAQNNNAFSCTGRVRGTVTPNPLLVAISHRKIVPVAGSTRGNHGSDFRTSLTLNHYPLTKGRIYFRPAGTQPSDSDPFVSYEFKDNDQGGPYTIHFDDVVAAMGASGMGSLEIVPDAGTRLAVPEVEVRVYNVTSEGTFGTRVPAVWAPDWFRVPDADRSSTLLVPAVQANFRRNVGFRTLTPVEYVVKMRTADGGSRMLRHGEAPANYTWFGSLDEFAGEPVPADARVTIDFFNGIAIAFRTETENATNDPTVVVSDPSELSRELFWR